MTAAQYLAGWSLPAIVCLVVGFMLLLYEMFTPGLGFPGLMGIVALIAAVILRADSLYTAVLTILLILVPLIAAAVIIVRSFSKGALSRSFLVLKETSDGEATERLSMQALVGREGLCTTALRPSGNADFDGLKLDVVADGEFVAKGAAVRITRIEGTRIIVKAAD